MPDFILEYDILEAIAKDSKSLGKRAEEYAESLDSKIISGIENITGPSTGYLMSASDSVRDKIIALKHKSGAFYGYAEQIIELLETAERIDQEVANTIAAQREDFIDHHEYLRLENWKEKLLDLLVDMKNSIPLLALIADILNSLEAILKPSKDTIKNWYENQEKKQTETKWQGNPDFDFIYGKTNLWKFPDLKNVAENGKVDLKDSIKQYYNKSTNSKPEANTVEWIGNSNYDNWLTRPAKKDIFDKLIDYVDKKVFGIEPQEKIQANQFFAGCFMAMQLDQQQAVNEFTETMTSTMKNAASYDLEIESESFPVNSIPLMPNNKISSAEGSGNASSSFLNQQYKYSLIKQEATTESKPIMPGSVLKDQNAIDALTKDGSNIGDWFKMESSKKYITEYGEGCIHFYKNMKTGKLSTYDAKIKVSIPKDLRTPGSYDFWIIDLDKNFIPTGSRY